MGLRSEGKIARTPPREAPTLGSIRQGFVYERVPHITVKSIANNAEIDVIWQRAQDTLEPLRANLNPALEKTWQEWEIPRDAAPSWPGSARENHAAWWHARITRQRASDASIAAKAEFEFLYDKPVEDRSRARVAGPFTVESLSPHRVIPTDDDDIWEELVATGAEEAGRKPPRGTGFPLQPEAADFAQAVLDHLARSGVHQARKEDRIIFTSLAPWPGTLIAAEGRFMEGETERRAAIFIGPEFGTVARPDLVAAAREAAESGFPVLIACAFNFDAHSSEFAKLGAVQVIRARMNADIHMAADLKAEIDEEARESLYREVSRPFPKPASGRIAVKVINHFGDDVMKVFSVQ